MFFNAQESTVTRSQSTIRHITYSVVTFLNRYSITTNYTCLKKKKNYLVNLFCTGII